MISALLCNFPQNALFIIVFMFVTCTPVRDFGKKKSLKLSIFSVSNGFKTNLCYHSLKIIYIFFVRDMVIFCLPFYQPWSRGYKRLSMKFFLLINVKMPTIVSNCWHIDISEQEK